MADRAAQGRRYQGLDILRGVAIIAMAVFHAAWDLYYFGFSEIDVTTAPGWVQFQKAILSTFLLLVGAGLWLGHGQGIRWRSFWRRWAFVAAGALLVTAGTLWMLPDYFVFFGVLHAIALFSLGGLALLRVPAWAQAALGVAIIGLSFSYSNPAFSDRTLAWIGFWPVSPPTSDVVPIFPWFGVMLLGMAGIRVLLSRPWGRQLLSLSSDQPLARGLATMGRWSLAIYLLHQPVIIGVFWGLSQLAGQSALPAPAPDVEAVEFLNSCESSCAPSGGIEQCRAYCACALDRVEADNLWSALAAPQRSAEQELAISAVTRLCRGMSSAP